MLHLFSKNEQYSHVTVTTGPRVTVLGVRFDDTVTLKWISSKTCT